MIALSDLERYTNTLLKSGSITDYAPNGIQLRGREEVGTLVTGVSACMELFQEAILQKADLILVHHGLFWEKESRVVEGKLKKRLKLLLDHDISVMAYHLPLDCHPELGNNRQILNRLALAAVEPFALYRGTYLSSIGESKRPLSLPEFAAQLRSVLGGEPFILPFGPEKIQRIAVCSGAAPELIQEAKLKGADLFLTGEATEHIYHFAKEEEIHFVAAGHHRTEKFGVQALGDHLAEQFGIEHRFIDIFNPL